MLLMLLPSPTLTHIFFHLSANLFCIQKTSNRRALYEQQQQQSKMNN